MKKRLYKEKKCPRCGKLHRGRRNHCSRSCGNHRTITQEQKEKISDSLAQYYATEDGAALKSRNSLNARHQNEYRYGYTLEKEQPLKESDFYLEIPTERPTLRDNQFIEGGDLWEEI